MKTFLYAVAGAALLYGVTFGIGVVGQTICDGQITAEFLEAGLWICLITLIPGAAMGVAVALCK